MSRTHPHTLFVLVHVTHPPHLSHPSLSKRILSPSNVPCAPHFRTECAVCALFCVKCVTYAICQQTHTRPSPLPTSLSQVGAAIPNLKTRIEAAKAAKPSAAEKEAAELQAKKEKISSAPALPGKNLSTPQIPTPSHPLSPAGDGIGASAGDAGAHDPADRRTGRRRRSHTGRVARGGQAAGSCSSEGRGTGFPSSLARPWARSTGIRCLSGHQRSP